MPTSSNRLTLSSAQVARTDGRRRLRLTAGAIEAMMKCLGSVSCVNRCPSLFVARTSLSIEQRHCESGTLDVSCPSSSVCGMDCCWYNFGSSIFNVLVSALVIAVATTPGAVVELGLIAAVCKVAVGSVVSNYIPVSAHDVFVLSPNATARWGGTARTRRSVARAWRLLGLLETEGLARCERALHSDALKTRAMHLRSHHHLSGFALHTSGNLERHVRGGLWWRGC